MITVLNQIQQHSANLPLPLQAELLNYVMYLEYKAQGLPASTTKILQIQKPVNAWQRE